MAKIRRLALRPLMTAAALALLVATNRTVPDAQAVGGINTLTVSPSHGRAASTFQLTYAISPCTAATGLTIGFSWSALPPAGPTLGTAPTDASRHATLTATPPLNAAHQPPAPGTYQVFGFVALPIGGATPNTEASTTYVIDPTPTATATPTPHPAQTVSATSSANAAGSAMPAASASSPTSTSPSAATSIPSASAQTDSRPGSSPIAHATTPGPWTLTWQPLAGAAALLAVLVGLALIGVTAWRRRKGSSSPVRSGKAA